MAPLVIGKDGSSKFGKGAKGNFRCYYNVKRMLCYWYCGAKVI